MFDKVFVFLSWLGILGGSVNAAPVQVKTIRTINQHGPANACGNWAVCNAKALCKSFMSLGTKLATHLHIEAHAVAKRLVPKRAYQLASDEVESLALQADILCLVLGKYPSGEIAPLVWNGSADPEAFAKMTAKYSKMLRIKEAQFVIPCICNVGGHWVMLGIVKREAQEPSMVFMDNCNGSDARVQPFVNYLTKLFSL